MELNGAADYRHDDSTNSQIHAAMDWFRSHGHRGESAEPKWELVMTPVAIDASMWGIEGYGPMGLIAVGGRIVVAFADRDEAGQHFVRVAPVMNMLGALAPVRGKRRSQRYFFYAKNDEGGELVLEFRSEIEARALARWTAASAIGIPGGGWDVMPLVPEIRLANQRGRLWWQS